MEPEAQLVEELTGKYYLLTIKLFDWLLPVDELAEYELTVDELTIDELTVDNFYMISWGLHYVFSNIILPLNSCPIEANQNFLLLPWLWHSV